MRNKKNTLNSENPALLYRSVKMMNVSLSASVNAANAKVTLKLKGECSVLHGPTDIILHMWFHT